MGECPNCGESFRLGFKDKLLRKSALSLSKRYPVLREVHAKARNYCNKCWKERVKPSTETMLKGR